MSHTFSTLKINPSIIEGLKKQGISTPTPIQELTVPAFMEGHDLIIKSHTGSGKTLAFVLPLLEKIDPMKREVQAIILAPTHELVMQIHEQITLLSRNSNLSIQSCPIIGEVNIEHQIKKLREKPAIIVGSCGRILDLMSKKKISATTVQTIILDEADHLLDRNQSNTVKKLLYLLPTNRQICLCSASITPSAIATVNTFMTNPVTVSTATQITLNPRISHFYMLSEQREKFDGLRKLLLATQTNRALIFVSQNTDTKTLVEKLKYHGHSVATISGKLTKEERKAALTAFRTGKVKLLVSSDLSARGLDVPDITHVIHFDFPLTPHEYLHRAGRSARGLKDGQSICLATSKDLGALRIFERDFGITITPIAVVKGQIKDMISGNYLIPPKPLSPKTQEEVVTSKKRNKYPKGYNSGKKEAKTATEATPKTAPAIKLKSHKNKEVSTDPLLTTTNGTLADALKLIAQDKFGKKYE